MKTLLYALALTATLAGTAIADDGTNDDADRAPTRHGFSVAFKPMSFETNTQEIAWQLLNVVDAMQSYQIAKYPACYSEVGTPAIFGFDHPTEHQSLYFSAGFAILHYAGARLIENLIDGQEPDENGFQSYRVLQRVYEYGFLAGKTYTVAHNASVGLGFDHASNHYNSPGCNAR